MIARLAIGVAVLAGCGRIGFDPDIARTADAPADTTTSDTPADGPLLTGLLAYFTFDDTPSDGADNSVIGAPIATCVSSCPIRTITRHGTLGAFQFNGTTDALRYADYPELHSPAGTVALWVRFTQHPAFDGFMVMACKVFGPGLQNTWETFLYQGPMLLANAGGDSNGNFLYADTPWTTPLAGNTWVHVAMSWGSKLRLYVGGVLVEELADPGRTFDGGAVYLGSDFDSGATFAHLDGALDDVYLFSRELLASEIAMLAAP